MNLRLFPLHNKAGRPLIPEKHRLPKEAELPPVWRVRKVEDKWWVLRLQPIRHVFYFKVAELPTHEEALHYICKREGACEYDL